MRRRRADFQYLARIEETLFLKEDATHVIEI